MLVKLQPPASGGAEGTPELLLRDFTCHPTLPGHYHPVAVAELREVGCSQPCSAWSHQAPFAGGGSSPSLQQSWGLFLPGAARLRSTLRVGSPFPGQAGRSRGKGLGLPQFPPCCGLRMRRKVRSAPIAPQRGRRAGPSHAGTFGGEKAKVAPPQLEGWKRNVGDGGQHVRLSD